MKKIFITIIFSFIANGCFAWPLREINIIVPYPPGGTNDQLARLLQPALEKKFKIPVVIKNMPGAANSVAIAYILAEKNDNHTFILTMDDFISGPLYQNRQSYKNFKAVTIIGAAPFLLFGNSKVTIDHFKNQIENHQNINIANNGVNSSAELWINNLKSTVTTTSIPYKGSAAIFNDVIAGITEYGVTTLGTATPFLKDNLIKPIMISSDTRNKLYPEVPTFKDLGFSGSDATSWFGIFTRKDTDDAATAQFSEAVRTIVKTNLTIQEFNSRGLNIINLNIINSEQFFSNEITRFEKTKK